MQLSTQIEAYNALDSQTRRIQVYNAVFESPEGLTRQEIAEQLEWPINCVTGRVTELLNADALVELGTKKNEVTGKKNAVLRAYSRVRA